jgi:hypothetical protein
LEYLYIPEERMIFAERFRRNPIAGSARDITSSSSLGTTAGTNLAAAITRGFVDLFR